MAASVLRVYAKGAGEAQYRNSHNHPAVLLRLAAKLPPTSAPSSFPAYLSGWSGCAQVWAWRFRGCIYPHNKGVRGITQRKAHFFGAGCLFCVVTAVGPGSLPGALFCVLPNPNGCPHPTVELVSLPYTHPHPHPHPHPQTPRLYRASG